jgi:flavin-dependent dehydrogenase
MPIRFGKHAVVVGAGIGGLTAAKAHSSYFEKVSVLERDALPAGPEARTGTPQSRQVHVLLRGGLNALTEFFPDFETELEQARFGPGSAPKFGSNFRGSIRFRRAILISTRSA